MLGKSPEKQIDLFQLMLTDFINLKHELYQFYLLNSLKIYT